MQILEDKTDLELIQSLLAETAKAQNEIGQALSDLEKAKRRLKFVILIANKMIERSEDQ